MGRQHHTAEEIINKLREAEVGLAKGLAVPAVCRKLGVAEQTYYPLAEGVWRPEEATGQAAAGAGAGAGEPAAEEAGSKPLPGQRHP